VKLEVSTGRVQFIIQWNGLKSSSSSFIDKSQRYATVHQQACQGGQGVLESSKQGRGSVRDIGDPGRSNGDSRNDAPLPGIDIFSNENEFLLFELRWQNPQQSLASYANNLQVETVISKGFKLRFPFKGSLRKTSIIPIDKYHPINSLLVL
jgi:hypothetical protein